MEIIQPFTPDCIWARWKDDMGNTTILGIVYVPPGETLIHDPMKQSALNGGYECKSRKLQARNHRDELQTYRLHSGRRLLGRERMEMNLKR